MTDAEIKVLFDKHDAEDERQNHRIDKLETQMNQVTSLAVSIERMATSIEHMADELKQQGLRISNLEQKPADRWEKIIQSLITAIVGVLIGILVKNGGI